MKKRILSLLVVVRLVAVRLAVASFVTITSFNTLAATEIKGDPEELRRFLHPQGNIVAIQGNAEKTAYTDKAIIDLLFTTEEKLLSDSLAKNSQLRSDISTQLIKSGIKAEDINSAKFSSDPEYGLWGKKPKSYKVSNRMSVTITDEKQLQNIAALADKHDEIELSGSRFEHSKKEQFEQEIKAQALAKVMEEKASYEKTLGVTLQPIGINNIYVGQNASEGAMLFQNQAKVRMNNDMVKSMVATPVAESSPASFDEVKYFGNISVSFQVITRSTEQ